MGNAIDLFNKYAKQYNDKYMDTSLYHESFDLFCNSIPQKDAHILEIACGPGNITKYLLSKRPDFKILGIDLAANMLELARHNNPSAEFLSLDCRDIAQLAAVYDGVLVGFCLPYLSREETEKLIRDAAAILKPGGVLYLSTMEGDYAKSGFQKSETEPNATLHIYYHEAAHLTGALAAHDFKLLDLQRKRYPAPDGGETTDLLMLAAKKT